MEWNRGPSPTQPTNQPANHAAAVSKKTDSSFLNLRVVSVVLLFCITVLLVALVSLIAFNDSDSNSKSLDKRRMQAVFLNGGQVYFGKINRINDKFIQLGQIYYLRVNQQVQPDGSPPQNQDISLVKLGCELHGPQDSMIINQDQVIFWENLKDDGQVAKAVDEFVKQNPNGQKCEQAADTNNKPATPAATTPAPTPTTNTNKKP